jgi:LCP family protein required for cell wall assembly
VEQQAINQDTVERQTIKMPLAGPAGNVNAVQAQMRAYGQVPPSPSQSSITPFAAMNANAQTLQPPYTRPIQNPGIQPFSPPFGPNNASQPFTPPLSMPGYSPTPLSPVPMGYPGPGAPPPFWQEPQDDWGKTRERRRFPTWARLVVFLFLLLLIVVGGAAGYYFYFFSAPVSHIVGQQVTRLKGDEDPNGNRNGADILSGSRINILLLGSDSDAKFSNGQYLAQTDIVVTIDPASRKVGMLSIPRDFWINVPGSGMHKLDEAYGLGGVALSRLTIFQDFGIPINYYAWVGLDGFIKVIDTVGGIDVDVLHPITDDNYPDDVGNKTGDIFAYKRLYIPPGPQHLSGPAALEYVRSRHADLVGDFGRSARQQQVLGALKTKLNNPDIIGKLPNIAHDLDGYVRTDMQLTDVLKLVNFARSLDPNSIQRVILGPPYSSSGTAPGGSGKSVVFPNCALIVPVIAQMFALGNNAACNIQANSSNSSLVSASPPPSTSTASANATWQSATQVVGASAINLSPAAGSDNLFGFHSLLDLMLMVVFESPQAIQA